MLAIKSKINFTRQIRCFVLRFSCGHLHIRKFITVCVCDATLNCLGSSQKFIENKWTNKVKRKNETR